MWLDNIKNILYVIIHLYQPWVQDTYNSINNTSSDNVLAHTPKYKQHKPGKAAQGRGLITSQYPYVNPKAGEEFFAYEFPNPTIFQENLPRPRRCEPTYSPRAVAMTRMIKAYLMPSQIHWPVERGALWRKSEELVEVVRGHGVMEAHGSMDLGLIGIIELIALSRTLQVWSCR